MGDRVASSTTVEMEAAEQLIELSGGCDDAGGVGGGESESRSADSVKAGEERQRGDDKEVVPAVVESGSVGKRHEKVGAEENAGGAEDDEAVMGGVQRRKPRFRSLAAIYRETKRVDLVPCHEVAEENGSSKGKEKKRATGGVTHDEAVAAAAAPSKARSVVRRRSSTVRESS